MTIDGFRPEDRQALRAFDPKTADVAYRAIDWVATRVHIEIVGADSLPKGGALIVANHAFGWDVAFPMAAVWRTQRRPIWALGEHLWWKVPFLRTLAAALGTVDGSPENADRLLARGELVLVLPGGLREAVKPRELRYRLLWGHRYGFVRSAIRNQVPIVPLVSMGADEIFDLVGNADSRGARWLGKVANWIGYPQLPLPRAAKLLPIPHRVHLKYVFGDPIFPRFSIEHENDLKALRSLRHEVEGALHELIEQELAKRVGIDLS